MRSHPSLFQVNTRVWLQELGAELGRPPTLDDVPESCIDGWAAAGFDWIWLLGVWQTGPVGRQISRSLPDLREEFERTLPDLTDEDICGSCFAIADYTVHEALGGDEALARLRNRLRASGLRLLLDFVPNHTAIDHPWVGLHPEFYVHGTEGDLAREPGNYVRLAAGTPSGAGDGSPTIVATSGAARAGDLILAHGRDPYFPGWTDTLQLDYGNPSLQAAMQEQLLAVADRCDGVRCDMAMLILPDVFARTWGREAPPFWPQALGAVRARHPEFLFVAEVYWDRERTLQQQGFDYTYDKRLYDRLRDGQTPAVRSHLQGDLVYQEHMARFLENHDEPRATVAFLPKQHEAAAVITFLTPGLRFFHQGQREGRRIRIPVQLCRGPAEAFDRTVADFYDRLLAVLRHPGARGGEWRLLDCTAAWDANPTHEDFVCFCRSIGPADRLLVVANYAPHDSQCYVRLPWADLDGGSYRLVDLLGPAQYARSGSDLVAQGLYLDLPPWGCHAFAFESL